jgi:hypothetical protein
MNKVTMNKELMATLVWVGGTAAVTLGAIIALKLGYIDDDTCLRVVIGFYGLMVAWYGNRMPKTFVRSSQLRQVRRVSAWSQVLSGLVYAGLWAFAPIPLAMWGGVGALLAGSAVTLGYFLWLQAKPKAV